MGCCVSSGKSINSTHKLDRNSTAAAVKNNENREPPSVVEEETVKEVLTETPALKPPPSPAKNFPPEEDEAQEPIKNEENEIQIKLREIPINGITQQDSQFHEIAKSNEFLAAANFIDGGGEKSSPEKFQKNQLIIRDVELKRELQPNKTLNRRSDRSPVRRNRGVGSARFVQNRDVSPATARRGLRAEPDENSGRRSRSPATARIDGGGSRSALGRTPSARKAGKSSPMKAAATTAAGEKRIEENNIIDENCNSQIESLENPLVSLECFIFL